MVTLVSLFMAGRLIAGTRGALLTVLLYAQYPLAVQQSVVFYPTAFQIAAVSLATWLICQAAAAQVTRSGALLAACAGVALGLGYLAKEDVAVVVLMLGLGGLVTRFLSLSRVVYLAAGAGAVFGAECVAYWSLTGNPLYRLMTTSGLGGMTIEGQLQISEIWRWNAYLRSLFLLPAHVGGIWWLAIPASWTAMRRGGKAFKFVVLTLILVFCYLQFGSGSIRAYVPLPKGARYTAIATPFLCIAVGAWFSIHLDRGLWKRVTVLAVALLGASIPCLLFLYISSSERMRNTLAALPTLRGLHSGRVYTNFYSARALRLLGPNDLTIRTWYHADFPARKILLLANPADDGDAYVLLDHQAAKIYTSLSGYAMQLPTAVREPRPHWELVWAHRAYPDGSASRTAIQGLQRITDVCPDNPVCKRIRRNTTDMIDADGAMLYRVSAYP
jgi:hypothetical protein